MAKEKTFTEKNLYNSKELSTFVAIMTIYIKIDTLIT
jgi:hypothetical protein